MKILKNILMITLGFTAGYLISEQVTIAQYRQDVKPIMIIRKELEQETVFTAIRDWSKKILQKLPFCKKPTHPVSYFKRND